MGILDTILGSVLGSGAGASSPMGGILASLLGGGSQAGGMGALGGAGGGIANLIQMFQQAGLGNIAQSWVGNGQNLPVSPQQLQTVFGQDRVDGMASQAGMQPQDFLSQLSRHLPNVVDQMTPNGRIPDEGTVSV